MGNTNMTLVEKLYIEALKAGPKDSSELTRIVRDRLTEIKGGNNPVGATGRSQAVLDGLEKDGYIVVIQKKFLGAKKYDITEKGKNAATEIS